MGTSLPNNGEIKREKNKRKRYGLKSNKHIHGENSQIETPSSQSILEIFNNFSRFVVRKDAYAKRIKMIFDNLLFIFNILFLTAYLWNHLNTCLRFLSFETVYKLLASLTIAVIRDGAIFYLSTETDAKSSFI